MSILSSTVPYLIQIKHFSAVLMCHPHSQVEQLLQVRSAHHPQRHYKTYLI